MSDSIGHECGIALIRLLRPLSYYHHQYGTPYYGLEKLYLMMEKQHNRGQDGAGVATIKLNVPAGSRYISRARSVAAQPLRDIFERIYRNYLEAGIRPADFLGQTATLQAKVPYLGELLLGHLRYGTHGQNSIETCHPFFRQHNHRSRNLVLAGNFNLTNVDLLFDKLVKLGQHPKEQSDTVTVMENIGHFLDQAHRELTASLEADYSDRQMLEERVGQDLDLVQILRKASRDWDGGFAMAGMLGHGDAFVLRDAHGIRPAFWYANDEVAVVASERPAIATTFHVHPDQVNSIPPGHVLLIRRSGEIRCQPVFEPAPATPCSFERIYFSRGNDPAIYKERIQLGKALTGNVLDSIDHDLENAVFSYIPNTAEIAFLGLLQGLEANLEMQRLKALDSLLPVDLETRQGSRYEEFMRWMKLRPRVEKAAIKDVKLRTFIAEDNGRNRMVRHVYDTTSGILRPNVDALVVIDDSIVRGTTLRESIVSILGGLQPRLLIIVSSAPQIRYPDCYGIDMSRLSDFVAFRALVKVLEKKGISHQIEIHSLAAQADLTLDEHPMSNRLQSLYALVEEHELSEQIAQLISPPEITFPVKVVYQDIESLHAACPEHRGDWYFSGSYPTSGGHRVANRALMYYAGHISARPY
jgi:amidophosphoribosyltransferase